MEAFNQQYMSVGRFVWTVLSLTFFTAMASAKLHTHIFVVCLLNFNSISSHVRVLLLSQCQYHRSLHFIVFSLTWTYYKLIDKKSDFYEIHPFCHKFDDSFSPYHAASIYSCEKAMWDTQYHHRQRTVSGPNDPC